MKKLNSGICFIIIVLVCALILSCTKKKTPVNITCIANSAQICFTLKNPLDSLLCINAFANDYWILNDSVVIKYGADYISSDSIIIFKKNDSDNVSRNGLYFRGNKHGDKIFFHESFIYGEEGIIKYVSEKDVTTNPTLSKNWKEKIKGPIPGIFVSLNNALDALLALNGNFNNVRDFYAEEIKKVEKNKNNAFSTPKEIKQGLKNYKTH